MLIEVNGKRQELNCATAFAARTQLGKSTDLVILNGFQLAVDKELAENDVLTIIDKGKMPCASELESMMMARHTPKVHKKLKKGKVAIAGLGGLGSNLAVMLTRIGVGQLLLVDFDIVEPSNLNRQSYYVSHLGKPKTEALQEQLNAINPFTKIEICTIKVTETNVGELFQDYEIICEAFDRAEAKAMLVNKALALLPAVKIVAASGLAGFASSNLIKTTRPLARLYVCGDLTNGAAPGMGLMAPRVQICAAHQANMVLRLLLGLEEV